MLKSTPLRSLSTTQWMVVGIVLIVGAFLLIGSIVQSSAPRPVFAIGLQTQPFLILAILSFAGGLLSFASPCTLPILPAYFAFAFQSGRRQIAANTITFMLGLATMFSLLGAGASALGRTLQQNSDLLLVLGGSVIVIFGVMSLLGKGFTGLQKEEEQTTQRQTLGGSYLFGLTFAVGWTSCVGPILGTVLTLAATTGSVLRGVMLLFIYTLGLGLPLIIVSTFFGRASRKSLFWRVLRGRGWHVSVPTPGVGLVWALAVWQILVALARFAFRSVDSLAGQHLTDGQNLGLLVIAMIGVALWFFTGRSKSTIELDLHSTQIFSGVLFVLMGLLMLSGRLATFNSLVPPDMALWFADIEDRLILFFAHK